MSNPDEEQLFRADRAEQLRERDRQREPSRFDELAEHLPAIGDHTVTLLLRGQMLLSGESVIRYRWRCSCGGAGRLTTRIDIARAGAIAHVEIERRHIERDSARTRVVHVVSDAAEVRAAAAGGRYVYIGRPSKWGNPYTYKTGTIAEHVVPVSEVLPRYEAWLRAQPELMAELAALRGKVLGCWCWPKPCHGDVLARLAEELG